MLNRIVAVETTNLHDVHVNYFYSGEFKKSLCSILHTDPLVKANFDDN